MFTARAVFLQRQRLPTARVAGNTSRFFAWRSGCRGQVATMRIVSEAGDSVSQISQRWIDAPMPQFLRGWNKVAFELGRRYPDESIFKIVAA
jgi:hypothetical protein